MPSSTVVETDLDAQDDPAVHRNSLDENEDDDVGTQQESDYTENSQDGESENDENGDNEDDDDLDDDEDTHESDAAANEEEEEEDKTDESLEDEDEDADDDLLDDLNESEFPDLLKLTAEERESFNADAYFMAQLFKLNTDHEYSEADLENEKVMNRAIDLLHHKRQGQTEVTRVLSVHVNYTDLLLALRDSATAEANLVLKNEGATRLEQKKTALTLLNVAISKRGQASNTAAWVSLSMHKLLPSLSHSWI